MLISLLLACGDEVDFQKPSKSPSEASNEPSSETASEPSSETSDEPSSETASEPSEEPSSEAASEPSSEVSNEPNDGPNPDGEWREELYISPTASHRMDITNFLDVPVANIWNGLAQANNGFYFSTHFDGLLTLRRLDWDLGELWPYVEITQVDDLEEGDILADHAMVRWNDKLYFAISTSGDRNLYLLSTDLNGIRIQDVVVQDDDDPRTNDPQLFVQSFAGEEAVCLRWGRSGPDKYLHCYDEDLNSLHGNTEIITSGPTSQLAHPMQVDDEIWVFSGDAPQRNLVYTRFDLDWNPLSPFEEIIIASENDEWNWASTGVAQMDSGLWVVAYTHMPSEGQDFDARGRMALFDANFELLHMYKTAGQATYRPHILTEGNTIVLSYDAGPVMVETWEVTEQ